MTLVLLATTLLDGLAVGALVWLVHHGERRHRRMAAEHEAVFARLRRELADLVADAERRARGLDEALALRESSLRVLLETSAPAEDGARARAADPAELRLVRDLELAFERPSPSTEAGA